MSRPIVACEPTAETRAKISAAWADYHASVAEYGPGDDWDRRIIDEVIDCFVRQGRPFSANSMRDLLPAVRKCLISRRLIVAQNTGLIRYVGVTPSTLKSTKGARVNVYAPVRGGER